MARTFTRRTFVVGLGAAALAVAAGGSLSALLPSAQAENGRENEASVAGAPQTPDPRDAGLERRTLFAFDTVVDLGIYGSAALLDEAAAACARYDALFSMQREESDVWRINHAGGAWCEVDPDTADLVAKSLAFCERSGGLFDVTIGAVSQLWDFKAGVKPDDAAIQAALAHVDWRGVEVRESAVRLADPQAALDLGGIAKGWVADALADSFRAAGVEGAIINLGGNVYALGQKPSGAPWTVGVRDPNVSAGRSVAQMEVRDRSVVTSGLYERHFELDGVDYHHILDPRTGYPAATDLLSATVVSERSLDGDGLSTTLFIEGSQVGFDTVEGLSGVDALFMDADGTSRRTAGFDAYRYVALEEGAGL